MAESARPKTSEVLTIRPDDGVSIIERFAIDGSSGVEDALRRIASHVEIHWRNREDYRGSLLLRHRVEPNNIFVGPSDVSGVAVYSRWQPGAAGEKSAAGKDEWSVAALLPESRMLGSRSYTVDFSESVGGGTECSPVSLDATPIAHMGIFSNFTHDQESVLVVARRHSAESLSPGGVVGVNFHASVDGQELINLGQWESVDFLAALSTQARFAADDHYWDGMCDFEGVFFDVVAVDPGNSAR
jgi:hypothetical protein